MLLVEEAGKQRDEWRQIVLNGLPDSRQFDIPILVHSEVTHIAHQTPWNGWRLTGYLTGDVTYSFVNHNEVTPMGKPPPLAVRLEKALPFRR
jgi:hypothetical protein